MMLGHQTIEERVLGCGKSCKWRFNHLVLVCAVPETKMVYVVSILLGCPSQSPLHASMQESSEQAGHQGHLQCGLEQTNKSSYPPAQEYQRKHSYAPHHVGTEKCREVC